MSGTSTGIPDFSIIGAGIMGLCLARELHAAGAHVAVYERAPASPEQLPALTAAAGTAAWAAAGMLGPSGFPPHIPLHSFALSAAAYYPDFAAGMERETGIHCDYRRIGTLASRHGMGGAHAAACAEASCALGNGAGALVGAPDASEETCASKAIGLFVDLSRDRGRFLLGNMNANPLGPSF